jgi:hypothetical protein
MTGAGADGVRVLVGETVTTAKRRIHVSERDVESVALMREMLIEEARARATVTYGELVRDLALPTSPKGLGRLLDLLSEDCTRRGEPTLAAIVVTATTGEVGRGYGDGAAADRDALYRHWSQGVSWTE